MFLTPDELRELTGYTNRPYVISWLKDHGYNVSQIGKDGCARPTAYRAPVRRRTVQTARATYYYDSHGRRVYR